MFNGTLIDELFAVVKRAETSARSALPEVAQSRAPNSDPPLLNLEFPQDRRQEDCRERNSETE